MHNECVSLVADLARDCSFYVRVEPRRVFQTTRDRPDLLISHYHPRSLRPAAIDLTFHSSTAPSNRGSAAFASGHHSLLRERHKSKKYAWQTDILNYFFIGCGMDDGGAMGPSFKELIDHLCKRGANLANPCLNWSAPTPKVLFYQKLSLAVQKGFAARAEAVGSIIRKQRAYSTQAPAGSSATFLPSNSNAERTPWSEGTSGVVMADNWSPLTSGSTTAVALAPAEYDPDPGPGPATDPTTPGWPPFTLCSQVAGDSATSSGYRFGDIPNVSLSSYDFLEGEAYFGIDGLLLKNEAYGGDGEADFRAGFAVFDD